MYEDFFGPRRGSGGAAPKAKVAVPGAAAPKRRGVLAAGSDSDDEEEDEELEDWGGASGSEGEGSEGEAAAAGSEEAEEEESDEPVTGPSTHERRLERLQQRIQRLEEAAMGPKDWFMRGEADAGEWAGRAAGGRERLAWRHAVHALPPGRMYGHSQSPHPHPPLQPPAPRTARWR